MVCDMAGADACSLIIASTKESSAKENSSVRVKCAGVMVAGTKATGFTVKWTGTERKSDRMVACATKVNGERANPLEDKPCDV